MKKKAKKPLFDSRAPGGKMIVYGAVLMILGAIPNAYWSWRLSLVVSMSDGAVGAGDIFGPLLSYCLQVALSLLVALDGINNRNRPSKGRSVMINAICVAAISIFLLIQVLQGEGTTNVFSNALVAGVSIAGAVLMFIGGFKNRKVFGNGKSAK